MRKFQSIGRSLLWAAIVIAFPVVSGIIVVIGKADAVTARLVQGGCMYAAAGIPFIYCRVKKISLQEIFLAGIDRSGVKACLFYIPLIVILLPMIISGVDLTNTDYILATFFFTLGVGIAEELYFRGIILKLLGERFGSLSAAFISALIFGIGHLSGAFVENSAVMVLLSVLNAFLFGWVAAEAALITKNIIPLMIFHCLFDFLTYQMLATGKMMVVIYLLRGTAMTVVAVYLQFKLKQLENTPA